ncbi:MAG: UDP-N-acetylmuramoyl-L-alanyl-D-glutamate--2,6-diaminopimelate ligase [Prevotellaceae bacterium]|jgi:UDP-N-acetylmuramoyl-L-alanyl-D-glutamate--2,6-diaminopimelate ligase|nr:UDP-N-acetylmuramoyl-L-alanyl-D-glutamate--2,6-diaminopimelate ligase [Prevotellaceae bacterium]
MKLSDLIIDVQSLEIKGVPAIEITSLGLNSQTATNGQLFFALRGEKADGHHFIEAAVAKGAAAVVCEQLPEKQEEKVCYVVVKNSHAAMGKIAATFYGNPSKRLQLVGVTGTNGKTTTATLLYRLFRALGYKAGLLSTVTNFVDNMEIPATHTTPDAITLNKLLAEMVRAGCAYCFMEVSSHAIVQERIAGLHFAGALFSNITHDHLDYHKTFSEYIRAKKLFFDNLPDTAFALVNVDDRNGRVMVQNTKAKVKTYALHSLADFHCRIIEKSFEGMQLQIDGMDVWTPFIGVFNAYNLLAVYATAQLLGVEKNEALRLLSAMTPVAGRFEKVHGTQQTKPAQPLSVGHFPLTVIVDYAHTPDALQNVLNTINDIRREEQLVTVAGCGGNRDAAKRPVMACIAADNSDKVIFTSDNPRFEEPETILADMKAGLDAAQRSKSLFITDRREAIRTALMLAQSGSAIVLIAGKGHETYQEIKGKRIHFDDKETARELLHELKQIK